MVSATHLDDALDLMPLAIAHGHLKLDADDGASDRAEVVLGIRRRRAGLEQHVNAIEGDRQATGVRADELKASEEGRERRGETVVLQIRADEQVRRWRGGGRMLEEERGCVEQIGQLGLGGSIEDPRGEVVGGLGEPGEIVGAGPGGADDVDAWSISVVTRERSALDRKSSTMRFSSLRLVAASAVLSSSASARRISVLDEVSARRTFGRTGRAR